MRPSAPPPRPRRPRPHHRLKVAVIAHTGKTIGGGLSELLGALVEAGCPEPDWHEVDKSRKALKKAKRAIKDGVDVILAWGGDGLVQRCIDAAAGTETAVAIVPAGTANLLATHLGIPKDVPACVNIALHGARKKLDVGQLNGERFAVMAGVGFDALMMRDADKGLKARVGRLAYVWTGAKRLDAPLVKARIEVDGKEWFRGPLACVLAGNVGSVFGGITLFPKATPDDGVLQLGVVTAQGATEWANALASAVVHKPGASPFVELTPALKAKIKLARPMPYELDGSVRPPTDRLKLKVKPGAITMCVPTGPAMGRRPR